MISFPSFPEIPKSVWEAAAKAKESEAAKKAKESVESATKKKLAAAQMKMVMQNMNQFQDPAALRKAQIQQENIRLQSIATIYETNQKELGTHQKVLSAIVASQGAAVEQRLQTILDALRSRPPRAPAAGSPLDAPEGGAERYFSVINERENADITTPTFIISTRVQQIVQDQQYIASLYPQFQSRPDIVSALRAVWNSLDRYARTDVAAYIQHAQGPTVMGEGLANMGKILAAIGLGAYALASGTIDLANGNVPWMAVIAGGGIYVLGSERFRQSLTAQDKLVLDDVNSVINGQTFRLFSQNPPAGYGFFLYEGRWAQVMESLMQDSSEALAYIAKLKAGTATDTELAGATGVSVGTPLFTQVKRMTQRRRGMSTGNSETDFETFVKLLKDKKHPDAQEAIVNYVRLRATGNAPGLPKIAPKETPKSAPKGVDVPKAPPKAP